MRSDSVDSAASPVQPAASRTGGASRWFRFNLWLHRWASLVVTVPFLILCLSGTVLIFHEEIDAALGTVPTAPSEGKPALPLAVSVASVLQAHPGERVGSIAVDPKEHPGVGLLFMIPNAAADFAQTTVRYTDLATGELLDGVSDPDKTLTGFLFKLHAEWFLGPVGELVGAFIALLVLLSLLSGLVVYAPYVKRVVFGVLRRGRGPRLLQLDLHNFIGAVVLGWALVVTLTGLALGLGTVAFGQWQSTELAALNARGSVTAVDARQPPITVDAANAAALAMAEPGWRVGLTTFPGTDFSTPGHYTVFLNGATGVQERLFRVMLVDAATGEVAVAKTLPWYLKAIALAQPLHFGDYGGLALKLLWTACVWLTLFITANGAWLWWNRRRGRRPSKAGAAA